MHPLFWPPLAVIFFVIVRVYHSIIAPRGCVPCKRGDKETCHLAVFLGSGKLIAVCVGHPFRLRSHRYLGGHTSEALSLVSALDFSRYNPRTYLVSEGDPLSEQKVVALERSKAASASSFASLTCFFFGLIELIAISGVG
jgi:beta-1,4-N-acetylglucosaminyltransferase